jgi:retron-type reverse transcriptase
MAFYKKVILRFPFYKKILLLPEVPQMSHAQEITHKLFLQLRSKIKNALLKIQKIINEYQCLNIIVIYLRFLDKFQNSQIKNVRQIYRILKDPNFLFYAYSTIKNPYVWSSLDNVPFFNVTVGGVIKLAEELNNYKYKPNPVRIVKVTDSKEEFRLLGCVNFKDKIVQQALYMILSSFYELSFSKNSYGFRPGKSSNTCLDQMKKTWKKIT